MLETEIKKLTAAIEKLTAALENTPAQEQAPAPEPVETKKDEPEDRQTMPVSDLTRLCLGLSRDGHKDAIKVKLSELGAERITKLSAENYPLFVDWAIELAERAEVKQ